MDEAAPQGAALPERLVYINVHGVGRPGRVLDPGEDRTWITIEQLESVLDAAVGQPHVALTFDDGNQSDVEVALPRLLERGLTAQFFVLAGRLGEPGSLTADGVRELHQAGMSIGSHGWAHRNWRTVDWTRGSSDVAQQEVREASGLLADLTGSAVTEVAIPFGMYDRKVLAHLRNEGVTRVYTSDGGWARARAWLQPRNSIHADDSLDWARQIVTRRPSLRSRARGRAARTVKRLRG
jgi:peptidoglycan/xylan/chitin deacetylase (PgdA/CDA1 family)